MDHTITHEKYGVGIIKSVEKTELGYNVTVEFESIGEKVLLCVFNPLEEKAWSVLREPVSVIASFNKVGDAMPLYIQIDKGEKKLDLKIVECTKTDGQLGRSSSYRCRAAYKNRQVEFNLEFYKGTTMWYMTISNSTFDGLFKAWEIEGNGGHVMITSFSQKTIEELGYYVYVYSDPDTHKPFYVGKGKGNRAFDHLYSEGDS